MQPRRPRASSGSVSSVRAISRRTPPSRPPGHRMQPLVQARRSGRTISSGFERPRVSTASVGDVRGSDVEVDVVVEGGVHLPDGHPVRRIERTGFIAAPNSKSRWSGARSSTRTGSSGSSPTSCGCRCRGPGRHHPTPAEFGGERHPSTTVRSSSHSARAASLRLVLTLEESSRPVRRGTANGVRLGYDVRHAHVFRDIDTELPDRASTGPSRTGLLPGGCTSR